MIDPLRPTKGALKRNKVVMVYPMLGMAGAFVKHAPLGLLYASTEAIKLGYEIVILDARLHPDDWEDRLRALLGPETLAVGISVMTGKPILGAIRAGEIVKSHAPEVAVVWGGPFATFTPEMILSGDPNCDFAVSGYGAKPFADLLTALSAGRVPEAIPGIYYRHEGEIRCTPADWSAHEFIDYRDIPYALIPDYSVYGQLDQDKSIFSLYSAMGCAYNCAFCSSPALYNKIVGKRWRPFPTNEVVDHIAYVVENFGADYIYFIDDDSFVSIAHVEAIIDEINRRGLKVKLGFRGARINEIKLMSHEFLDKLCRAGTDMLHVGAESGSNRILKLVRKNCTVDDIIECNRKLAQHPSMQVFYNFILGLPTEEEADLRATAKLMLQLVDEHPGAIIGNPNMFRPLPGTELFEMAVKEWGYTPPATLQQFADVEVEGTFAPAWLSARHFQYCRMLNVASYFIDDKIGKTTHGGTFFYRVIKILSDLYAPFAKARLRYNFPHLLFEDAIFRLASRFLAGR